MNFFFEDNFFNYSSFFPIFFFTFHLFFFVYAHFIISVLRLFYPLNSPSGMKIVTSACVKLNSELTLS